MTNGVKVLIVLGGIGALVGGYFLIQHLNKPKGITDAIKDLPPIVDPVTGQAMRNDTVQPQIIPTNNPNAIVSPFIGKKVYANQDNAPVYLRDMTLYKRAKKDEYIMTVTTVNGEYLTDGVRQVNKVAVHA